jgi:hypothetical protein
LGKVRNRGKTGINERKQGKRRVKKKSKRRGGKGRKGPAIEEKDNKRGEEDCKGENNTPMSCQLSDDPAEQYVRICTSLT